MAEASRSLPRSQASCKVVNDLKATIEIRCGKDWEVLYPKASLDLDGFQFQGDLDIAVRLRENGEVGGSGVATPGTMLHASRDFAEFGWQAEKFIQSEVMAAAEERRLRKEREAEVTGVLHARVSRAALRKQICFVWWSAFMISGCLGLMTFCTVWTYEGAPDQLQAVGLGVGVLLLWWCSCVGFGGMLFVLKGSSTVPTAVRAARPELSNYEEKGEVRGNSGWIILPFLSCCCCVPPLGFGCTIAMLVAYADRGSVAAVVIVALLSAVPLGLCCVTACCNIELAAKAREAFLFLFLWPFWILAIYFGDDFFARNLVHPSTASLDEAVLSAHQHTIVFEGNVLPGRNTVASWPGKYESAWDELVRSARDNELSAGVVFLPEGSRHFGLHDGIPAKPELRDLQGSCWCTPLYGEAKPWGCRWWTRWIKNVETAVRNGSTLEVYFFNGKKGLGKVKDFTTAGEEHRRREHIFSKKAKFEQSPAFRKALDAGLVHLSDEKGSDSSSPYSREVHRLFLAWLPEDERQFLAESEGLGNSQKAEVAWLERKGYPYVEKEVSELDASSPKAKARTSE